MSGRNILWVEAKFFNVVTCFSSRDSYTKTKYFATGDKTWLVEIQHMNKVLASKNLLGTICL